MSHCIQNTTKPLPVHEQSPAAYAILAEQWRLCIVFFLMIFLAHPTLAEETTRSLKSGDKVVVIRDEAKLMKGSDVLATFKKGTVLAVGGVKGEWIGCHVTVNGTLLKGWVTNTEVSRVVSLGTAADGDSVPVKKPALATRPESHVVLPLPPSHLNLPEEVSAKLREAIAAFSTNQVLSTLEILAVITDGDLKMSSPQKEYLDDLFSNAQAQAARVLQQDLDSFVTNGNLRNAMIAAAVLSHLERHSVDRLASLVENAPRVSGLLKDCCEFNVLENAVWQVADVQGEVIDDRYTEQYGLNKKVYSARDGFRLLRVKAQVTNVSPESDPEYTAWVLDPARRTALESDVASAKERGEKTPQPSRLAGDTFIFLLGAKSTPIPCEHVCKGCSVLRGGISDLVDLLFGISSSKTAVRTVFPGTFVESAEVFEIDVLFHIPKAAASKPLRLLMIGAPPAAVNISHPSEGK